MKIGERLSINKVRKGYIIKKHKSSYVVVNTNICRDQQCSSITVYPILNEMDIKLLYNLLNTKIDTDILDVCQVLDYDDFVNDIYTYIDHLVIKRR